MSSKFGFGALLAVAVAGLLVLSPIPEVGAAFNPCAGITHADDANWTDHYWVGSDYYDGSPSCDLNGMFTLAVQRVHEAALSNPQSGPDGLYGAGTQADVRTFQGAYGLTKDGLVGPASWNKYDNYLRLRSCDATGWCHWYQTGYATSINLYRQRGYSTLWDTQRVGFAGWTAFDTGGPR